MCFVSSNRCRLFLSSVLLFGSFVSFCFGQAVQQKDPIEKEGLLRALKKRVLTEQELIAEIRARGVNFILTSDDERDIRKAAQYLSGRVDPLISAIRAAYKPRASGIFLDVTLYEQNKSTGSQGLTEVAQSLSDATLRYWYERSKDQIDVNYAMPYLTLASKGGPVPAIYDSLGTSSLIWQFPALAIKVVNNTNQTLLVSEAAIDVKESHINNEPLLVINPGYYYRAKGQEGITPIGAFHIINQGWGDVIDGKLELQITSPVYFPALNGLKESFELGTFSEIKTINILSSPPKAGEGCNRALNGMGGPSEYVSVDGEITYFTESHQKRRVRFNSPVRVKYCGGLLGDLNITAAYDVQLEAGKSGYVKYVPIAQSIKPGDADYFLLRVGSDKSAQFNLGVSFRTSGPEARTVNVLMNIFVPRSGSDFSVKARQRLQAP